MKKIFVLLIFIPVVLWGQSDPHATFFQFDHMNVNPGYAGMSEGINVTSIVRDQWMGWDGSPSNQRISADMPFKLFGAKHGVGLTLLNDEAGFTTNIGIGLNYAFRQEIAEGFMGIGVGFGLKNQSLNSANWLGVDGSADSDPNIPSGADDKPIFFDLRLGGFYQSDKLYFGLSFTNINGPKVGYAEMDDANQPYYQMSSFLTFGYSYQLTNPLFELTPAARVYTAGSMVQFACNGVVTYKNRFWGGAGFRGVDAVSVLGGAEIIEGLNVGLAYDIPTSQTINTSTGSFEFTIQYIFKVGVERDENKYKSIRFL